MRGRLFSSAAGTATGGLMVFFVEATEAGSDLFEVSGGATAVTDGDGIGMTGVAVTGTGELFVGALGGRGGAGESSRSFGIVLALFDLP
jgi:hypothetical protein